MDSRGPRKTPHIIDIFTSIALVLDLEEHHLRVSEAVNRYIEDSVRNFDVDIRADAAAILKAKSQGTFLWVYLVCRRFAHVSEADVFDELDQFPMGLDALYERMFEQTPKTGRTELSLCHQIIGIVLLAYRSMRPAEIVHALEIPENLKRFSERKPSPTGFLAQNIRKLVGQCDSFLSGATKHKFYF